MGKDEDFVSQRIPGKIYFSKEFPGDYGEPGKKRFLHYVLESGERDSLAEVQGELVIRVTPAGREQIKALFYVDSRKIQTLTLQRFSGPDDKPRKEVSFSLQGEEITKLLRLVAGIQNTAFVGQERFRIDEGALQDFDITKGAARVVAQEHLDVVADIAEKNVTQRDIIASAYRRNELDHFRRLLEDQTFFDAEAIRLSSKPEAVWQKFFERNPWIFGYGLFYVFTSALSNERLEQVVAGHSIKGAGKRTDALLRTRGRVSSLCFVEIKTHLTQLLESHPYRPDTWPISRELAGAVAQAQRTIHSAQESIRERLDPRDGEGNPTGDSAYFFRPRSVVICGNLAQFESQGGVNVTKFSSFELFRRQLQTPEVITFDELYERAKFIIESSPS